MLLGISVYGTELRDVSCPYCGESLEIVIDTSVSNQEYVEDCQVCCRPITMRVTVDGEQIDVRSLHENEY